MTCIFERAEVVSPRVHLDRFQIRWRFFYILESVFWKIVKMQWNKKKLSKVQPQFNTFFYKSTLHYMKPRVNGPNVWTQRDTVDG